MLINKSINTICGIGLVHVLDYSILPPFPPIPRGLEGASPYSVIFQGECENYQTSPFCITSCVVQSVCMEVLRCTTPIWMAKTVIAIPNPSSIRVNQGKMSSISLKIWGKIGELVPETVLATLFLYSFCNAFEYMGLLSHSFYLSD